MGINYLFDDMLDSKGGIRQYHKNKKLILWEEYFNDCMSQDKDEEDHSKEITKSYINAIMRDDKRLEQFILEKVRDIYGVGVIKGRSKSLTTFQRGRVYKSISSIIYVRKGLFICIPCCEGIECFYLSYQ